MVFDLVAVKKVKGRTDSAGAALIGPTWARRSCVWAFTHRRPHDPRTMPRSNAVVAAVSHAQDERKINAILHEFGAGEGSRDLAFEAISWLLCLRWSPWVDRFCWDVWRTFPLIPILALCNACYFAFGGADDDGDGGVDHPLLCGGNSSIVAVLEASARPFGIGSTVGTVHGMAVAVIAVDAIAIVWSTLASGWLREHVYDHHHGGFVFLVFVHSPRRGPAG